jgi:YcxB-like protein
MPFSGTLPEIECWCNDFLKCSAQNAMLNIAPALPIALTVMWIWFLNWIPTHGSQSATRRHIQRTMHQNSCRHLLELVGFLRGCSVYGLERSWVLAQSKTQRILFWVSMAVFGYFCFVLLRLPGRSLWGGIFGIAALVIFVLFLRYGAAFFAARSFVKKNPDKLGPAKHSIGPEGISNENSHGESKAKWTGYLRIKETPRFFLLYPQSNFAQILPKRCFDSPLEVERYRQVLKTYYKDKLELLS